MTKKPTKPDGRPNLHYDSILGDISNVIDAARQSTARSVNCIMTAAYWLIGRRIVEFEQKGKRRAEYGEALIEKLAGDLSASYGKGFSIRNVWQMKAFYLAWDHKHKLEKIYIYEFESASQLIEDFWEAVEEILK